MFHVVLMQENTNSSRETPDSIVPNKGTEKGEIQHNAVQLPAQEIYKMFVPWQCTMEMRLFLVISLSGV